MPGLSADTFHSPQQKTVTAVEDLPAVYMKLLKAGAGQAWKKSLDALLNLSVSLSNLDLKNMTGSEGEGRGVTTRCATTFLLIVLSNASA